MEEQQNRKRKESFLVEKEKAFKQFSDALFSPAESLALTEKKEEQIDIDYENAKLSLTNRKEKRKIRNQWNRILTMLVVSGFLLSYVMVAFIGLGWLNFENNALAVPSVVAAGIVETYGLAKLAIKYFFSEDDTNGSTTTEES